MIRNLLATLFIMAMAMACNQQEKSIDDERTALSSSDANASSNAKSVNGSLTLTGTALSPGAEPRQMSTLLFGQGACVSPKTNDSLLPIISFVQNAHPGICLLQENTWLYVGGNDIGLHNIPPGSYWIALTIKVNNKNNDSVLVAGAATVRPGLTTPVVLGMQINPSTGNGYW